MENKILKEIEVGSRLIDIKFKDDYKEEMELIFKDKKIKLGSYHDQDCCERVYIDFEEIEKYKEILKRSMNFDKLIIKGVAEMGLLLCFQYGESEYYAEKIFIPCYNEQNGYYSDSLELQIQIDEKEVEKIDVTACKKDNIN